jgi:hypothetical protein
MDGIKMDLKVIEWGGMDWIAMAQDRDKWRALVNMVINILVPQNVGKFLSSCTMAASQEGVSFMKLVVYGINMASLDDHNSHNKSSVLVFIFIMFFCSKYFFLAVVII